MNDQDILLHFLLDAYADTIAFRETLGQAIGRLLAKREATIVRNGDLEFRLQDGVLVVRSGSVVIAQHLVIIS